MSGYYYPPHTSPAIEEEDFDLNQNYHTTHNLPLQQAYQTLPSQPVPPIVPSMPAYNPPYQFHPQSHAYTQPFGYNMTQPEVWTTPTVPSTYPFADQIMTPFPTYSEAPAYQTDTVDAGPSRLTSRFLAPDEAHRQRMSRSVSFASNRSSVKSRSHSDVSRSVSPNASEMLKWGSPNENGTWSCRFPGCSSRSTFNRGCDLRKHYRRHTKSLFCRQEGCPQATEGGFSSKKDRARHEAKHNPQIKCESEGCERLFSRVDNMKDHVRRVHRRRAAS